MEVWLELGLLVHVVLAVFSGTTVLLTALALVRHPKAAGGAARPPMRTHAGEPVGRLVPSATANA